MAPRRQREAAAPRQAANAAGRRNQTGAAAARLGPRNQTAAAASRNQTAAAAATGRPHARNRRSGGDFGNQGNAPVVDGEANRRCLTRNVGAQPNAAAADEVSLSTSVINYIASDRNMLFSNDLIPVSSLLNNTIAPAETDTAKTDTIVDHLMKAVDVAEPEAAARFQRVVNQIMQRQDEITGDVQRLVAGFNRLESQKVQVIEKLESEKAQKEAQVQKVTEELESERAQKTAEVQKVMEENVRLRAMLDKKEAQLQAMSEQCKFMALNHHN